MAKLVGASPLLVADGHHRYETALAYQAERRAAGGGAGAGAGEPGDEPGGARSAGYDAVLALVVEVSEQQLQVMAIHRVVSGLPTGFDLVGALGTSFELRPTAAEGPGPLSEMADVGALPVPGPAAGSPSRGRREQQRATTSTIEPH